MATSHGQKRKYFKRPFGTTCVDKNKKKICLSWGVKRFYRHKYVLKKHLSQVFMHQVLQIKTKIPSTLNFKTEEAYFNMIHNKLLLQINSK